MLENILLDLVDGIYAAAIEPMKFEGFLEALSSAVQGQWTMLMTHDVAAWRATTALSVGLDAAALEREKHYAPLNPFVARGRPFMQAGTVITGAMIVPDHELIRTEYYNDHLKPSDLHHVIGGTITRDQHGAALIGSARSQKQGPFGKEAIALFQALDPHLRRALAMQKHMALQDGARDALDKIPNGCVLLGNNGRVLAVNHAADRIFALRDGITCVQGRLDAHAPESSSRLRELIASATSTTYQPHPGGVMPVLRADDAQPYTVLVTPLERRPLDWGGVFPVAAVFIADPTCTPATAATLTQLYGFTPAEARLARALAKGEGLGAAAEKLEIGVNTAKTHLQHIFAKTQTSRQAELVRLLTSVGAMACMHATPPAEAAAEPVHNTMAYAAPQENLHTAEQSLADA